MSTRRRFIAIVLATVLCLPGCRGARVGGLDYIYWDLSEDAIVFVPTRLTLRVNEERSVLVILEGPIAHFVHYGWTVSSSSIALVASACPDLTDSLRECRADITAVAAGTATITFTASRHVSDGPSSVPRMTPNGDLLDRDAAMQVSVVP